MGASKEDIIGWVSQKENAARLKIALVLAGMLVVCSPFLKQMYT